MTRKYVAANGCYHLQQLFFDKVFDPEAPYTLSRVDKGPHKSLYLLYMEADDVLEYDFAIKNLDGWDHWMRLCECTWFKPHIEKWRKELEIRTRARALKEIVRDSKSGSKSSASSSKFIVEKGWRDKEGSANGRGRPTKDDIKNEANRLLEMDAILKEGIQTVRN